MKKYKFVVRIEAICYDYGTVEIEAINETEARLTGLKIYNEERDAFDWKMETGDQTGFEIDECKEIK